VSYVSNTSPLTNLAAIEYLHLLPQLCGNVWIPEAVARELSALSDNNRGYVPVKRLAWLRVRAVENRSLVESLLAEVDEGEAEAIALAIEMNARFLLIDERRGSDIAVQRGLRVTGILGILRQAKREQRIPAVKPLADDLIERAGFWISHRLYERFLSDEGE
jgi:hypothetical protein